ncbi:ladderlectin [Silurus asotus]|uniref:Ladderlectin n=1 Tax=Silurus asotus TaxID=30991 RepID=A0AAD5B1Z6_SILAS|nr:ladderlectin [Silurus asotus]
MADFGARFKTWHQYCLNLGANLVSIHSEAQYQHVKSVIRAKDPNEGATWIGLSCCAKIRHWLWSDGTKVTYTKWNPTEPNYMPRECCAHMNWSLMKNWNDIPCDLQYPFVCVKKRV